MSHYQVAQKLYTKTGNKTGIAGAYNTVEKHIGQSLCDTVLGMIVGRHN